MRPLYFFLRVTLPYGMRTLYGWVVTLNGKKKLKQQTIFVCNHPSAFIDPLAIANFQWGVVHFMTRSDVFKPWMKPITWACHMVPVYRAAEDGKENLEKNIKSFREAIDVLKMRRSLIMFGEGYTDDVFIRSLKPLKKGPARIAMSAMVDTNWQLDIKMQPAGLNYTHPKYFQSELLLNMGKVIHLKEYKPLFDENPNKAITQLTRDIEKELQDAITYVKDKSLAPFVENIQSITHKGMNYFHSDRTIPLEQRFNYSRNLANQVNEKYDGASSEWTDLKAGLETYFSDLKKENISENWVWRASAGKQKSLFTRLSLLLLGLPVFLLGLLHNFIPYIITKLLIEKVFKRDVFWSGVKLILGGLLSVLWNLPFIWLFHDYVADSYALGVLYFFTVPVLTMIIGYRYKNLLMDTLRIIKAPMSRIASFVPRRQKLLEQISKLGM